MALEIQEFIASKKGQPCEAGAEQLEAQLSMLNEPNLPNPLQVITDSDIKEANNNNTKHCIFVAGKVFFSIMTLKEDSDINIET